MSSSATNAEQTERLAAAQRIVVVLALIIPVLGLLRLRRPQRALLYTALTAGALFAAHAARASGAWPGPAWTFPPLAMIHIAAAYDAYRIMKSGWDGAAHHGYSSWPALTTTAIAIVVTVHATVNHLAMPFNIASASMAPALIQGDRVLVHKLTDGARGELGRGDVVLFQRLQQSDEVYVKRIVGLPGDHIRVKGQTVFLNGALLIHEATANDKVSADAPRWLDVPRFVEQLGELRHDIFIADPTDGINGEWNIPPQHYFLMGDNRNFSNDSRFLGPIAAENIIGKPYLIWWSAVVSGIEQTRWDRIGAIVE